MAGVNVPATIVEMARALRDEDHAGGYPHSASLSPRHLRQAVLVQSWIDAKLAEALAPLTEGEWKGIGSSGSLWRHDIDTIFARRLTPSPVEVFDERSG